MNKQIFALSLSFAHRYVLSRHSFGFIRIMTLGSLLGIALGVYALIVVMSLFNGFRALAYKQLQEHDPHIRIIAGRGQMLNHIDSLVNAIKDIPYVRSILPIYQQKIILRHARLLTPAVMFSADMQLLLDMTNIRNSKIIQSIDVSQYANVQYEQCYLSIGLADKLRVRAGDTLSLITPQSLERVITVGEVPRLYPVIVGTIFQTNNKEYDAVRILVPPRLAHIMMNTSFNSATMIDIRCHTLSDVDQVQRSLQTKLSHVLQQESIKIETWYDLHREFYDIMKFERMATFIIISLIVIVAVFNVFASLSMTVAEKTPNIGLLRALGATRKMVVSIFFAESMIVGCLGIVVGVVLGIGSVLAQQYFGIIELDPTLYVVSTLPIELTITDVGIVILVALILSAIAGILPARHAASIIPVQALNSREI